MESSQGLHLLQYICIFSIFTSQYLSLSSYFCIFTSIIFSYILCIIYNLSKPITTVVNKTASIARNVPIIIAQQLQINFNHYCPLIRYVYQLITWLFKLGINHLSLYLLAPLAITLILLTHNSLPIMYDLWNKPSNKLKTKDSLPILYGRRRCMYSELNSWHSRDTLSIPFMDVVYQRQDFLL